MATDVQIALQPQAGQDPAAALAAAASKLVRASLDMLIQQVGQAMTGKVLAPPPNFPAGLAQIAVNDQILTLKLSSPLPAGTAVRIDVQSGANGAPAVTVQPTRTPQGQPVPAQAVRAQAAVPPPSPQPGNQPAATAPVSRVSAAAAQPQGNAAVLPGASNSGPMSGASVTAPDVAAPTAAPAATAATPTSMPPTPGVVSQSPQAPAPVSMTPASAQVMPTGPAAAQPQTVTPPAMPPPPQQTPAAAAVQTQPAPVTPAQPAVTAAPPAAPAAQAQAPAAGTAPAPTPVATPPVAAPTTAPVTGAPLQAQPVAPAPMSVAPAPVPSASAPAAGTPAAPAPAPAAAPSVSMPPSAAPAAPVSTPQSLLQRLTQAFAPPPAATSPAPPPGSPAQLVIAATTQAAAQQQSAAPLLQALAARLPQLPPQVGEAAARVLASRISLDRGAPTGETLKQAVLRSGVFVDAPAKAGAPADTRQALTQLRTALLGFLGGEIAPVDPVSRRPPPPPGQGAMPRGQSPELPQPPEGSAKDAARSLLSQTDGALSRIRLMQLSTHGTEAARPGGPMAVPTEWNLELPMIVGHELTMAQLQIARDGKGKSEARDRAWRLRFALKFSVLGEVGAQVALVGRKASVALWAEDELTAETLESMLPELAPALAAKGLELAALSVRRGVPREAARPAGRLMDSSR